MADVERLYRRAERDDRWFGDDLDLYERSARFKLRVYDASV